MKPDLSPELAPPFFEMGSEVFEGLCRDLLAEQPGIATCSTYGERGQADRGVDVLAQRADGGTIAGQCKAYHQLAPGRIRQASDDFLEHADHWRRHGVREFLLMVGGSLARTQQQDALAAERRRFEAAGFEYEAWSNAEIARKLRLHPGLVARYCQPSSFWIERICGADAAAARDAWSAAVLTTDGARNPADHEPWIEVPAGPVWRGAARHDPNAFYRERPAHWVEVSRLRVGRWPVLVAELDRFVEAGGYRHEEWWHAQAWRWLQEERIEAPDDWEAQRAHGGEPAVGVSWWEADAYCRWLTEALRGTGRLAGGEVVRLATEAEWEKVARGGPEIARGEPNPAPERIYPWGDESPDRIRAHFDQGWTGRRAPVGRLPQGDGPYGTWDLAGNVWEWCADGTQEPIPSYPEQAPRDPFVEPGGRPLRIARGGGYADTASMLRISYRHWWLPSYRGADQGLRCVVARELT